MQDGARGELVGANAPPRISVIVRSTNRHSLGEALDSIAAQDYAPLEVIVVGASGADHPVPAKRAGAHAVRFAPSSVPLSRPRAANAGLDAARGEWITFLDDDDIMLPGHIAGLAAAQRNAGDAKFIHTLARARMADGSTEPWGQPFALIQLYERNFIHLATALFARSLVDAGCRFDPAFDIMQDWDFFLQCAQLTAFHFEPRQTFEWRADAGASGAGGGANQDDARFAGFRDRIYAKWGAQRDALVARVEPALQDAAGRAASGDLDGADAACRRVLGVSQNDPFALNLLAMVQRLRGQLTEARASQELACAVRPNDPSLLYNLAVLCRLQGNVAVARGHCRRALDLRADFAPARRMLAELDDQIAPAIDDSNRQAR